MYHNTPLCSKNALSWEFLCVAFHHPTPQMIVKLPPDEYQYTPEEISGHPSVSLFSHSTENTGDTHTTIFCLFDLMLKKSDDGVSFSTKSVLVDDNKCD